ncbi:MAG: hypothetical protein HY914_06210 [Desulfomonile tiedjei]|nr:hypothetical protein [Desulfomonile tiedjei]
MNESSACPPYVDKEIRCPRLGGPVTFAYCRVERGDLPCPRAIGCWRAYFDVEKLFLDLLGPEEFATCFFTPPQPKVLSLIELIEKARRVIEQKEQP